MHRYETMEDGVCTVARCETCSVLDSNTCQTCESGATLNTDTGKCDYWKVLLRQSAGTYLNAGSDWLRWNENDDTQPNYSVLYCLDDSYRNDDGAFKFKMEWPNTQTLDRAQIWSQKSNPL